MFGVRFLPSFDGWARYVSVGQFAPLVFHKEYDIERQLKMKIHDGERVWVLVAQNEMGISDFAHAMEIPRSTIYGLLDRKHWATDKLAKASKVLGSDLFAAYSEELNVEAGMVIIIGENGTEIHRMTRMEKWVAEDVIKRFSSSK